MTDADKPRRVLVAEDEALIRLDLAEMLREEGYEIAGEAGDGQEAVDLAVSLKPDLVIMDVKMPRRDGAPKIGKVPGQMGQVSYGVCWNVSPGRGFEYLSGVEVKDAKGLPAEFATVRLPAREYAVFTHRDNVSAIGNTIDKIWNEWVPQAGLKVASAPCFERYTEEFNPKTGMGGMEIWIPLEA